MKIDDLSNKTYSYEFHEGIDARSIGWLGDTVPNKGDLQKEIIDILNHYAKNHFVHDGELGKHKCEICEDKQGFHGEFWVEIENIRYVLPMAIFHYISIHHYLPPEEFILALKNHWKSDKSLNCRNGQCDIENSKRTGLEWANENKPSIPEQPIIKWWQFWKKR